MFIDTHCHLTHDNYNNLEELIESISPNKIIINGVNKETSIDAIELSKKYDHVYAAIGIHPEEINNETDLKFIEDNIFFEKIVAIGEVGLDYYWHKDNKEAQKSLFEEQIKLGLKYNKPIIIHSRDSIEDTYNILKKYHDINPNIKYILHCYSSSVEMAKKFLNMNIMFGIGGVLTFKNEKKLKEVISYLDLNKILLETDSPYLTPEPFRGKINTSLNIPLIAQKIAEIKNEDVDKILEITTKNAISQFDLEA